MNLSSLSVRRAVTVTMIYLIAVGFGVFSLARLKLDMMPDISLPMVIVITNYEGSSPEDIETLVTRPLESAVASVKNAEEIHSVSKQGLSLVMVEFGWGYDMEQAETDVRRAIELVSGYFPDDVQKPMVFAFDPSLQPIVMMLVTGPYPLDQLRRITEKEVKPRLERLPGIAAVDVSGGLEREIHVVLNPARMAALGIDVNAITGAVFRENMQIPGGTVAQGTLEFAVQTRGKYHSVEEIGEVLVGAKTEMIGMAPKVTPVKLKEVAQVKDSFYEAQRVLEADNEPAVFVIVRKQSGSNTVQGARAVIKELPEIQKRVAADLKFRIAMNQAEFIEKSIKNLTDTAWIGVLLTFLVLFGFLWNFRSALIVTVAIPVSVVVTFAVMDQMGLTLNVISMAGLALGIGMLVDNNIVVLENIYRLIEEGKTPWRAAIDGARTVGMAVTASTLTTVVVFVPVLFVPGIAGVMFKDMALVITVSLLMSLLVALTFVPLSASRALASDRMREIIRHSGEGSRFYRFREAYGRTLDWTLSRRKWVVLIVFVAIALTTGLYTTLRTDFMAHPDQAHMMVSIEAPVGSTLQETYARVSEAIKVIEQTIKPEEREMISLDLGVGKGIVALFSGGPNSGTIRIRLTPMSQRQRSQKEIEEEVRQALAKLPGIKQSVMKMMNISGSDIEVKVFGHDLETQRLVGFELMEQFKALPEVGDVTFSMEDQKPEVRVQFDRAKMAALGLSTAQVGNAISTYFQGRTAGRYAEGGDEYDILVRYDKTHRQDLEELRRMPVTTQSGAVIPLSNIARIENSLGPVGISRLDQARLTSLNVTLRDFYTDQDGKLRFKDMGKAVPKLDAMLQSYGWPEEFSYEIGGSAEDFQKSFRYLGIALLVAILLVYAVMASQFESLAQPFIILFTVPLAGLGVVWAFALTRLTMDVTSLVGVIMLPGIIVNNGIVMVAYADQLRDSGLSRLEAIARASRVRLRPVLMTALTTILAMVPLALSLREGSEMWRGLAIAMIGGMTVGTFLTLYIVPTLYTLFSPKKHVTLAERMGEGKE
ncbi:MAG: efflux RND transporter permease subunit [Deltaproteobacteria bacterium]|nr:efflux RND transporter permease subunit [Deltaproteobacteria bacterium]